MTLKIAVGRLTRPHGVKGEVKLHPFFPEALLGLAGQMVTIASEDGSTQEERKIVSVRGGDVKPIIKIEGYDTPEALKPLSGRRILAPIEIMPPLPEGRYYHEQIIGLPVERSNGELLGRLRGFFPAGEKDVWEIETADGGELLIPCIDETLKSVDLEKGVIVMDPMETF